MRLSDFIGDLVTRLDIVVYPVAAMLLFMAAFSAIVLHTLSRRRQQTFERARYLPLEPVGPLGPGDSPP